jgi:hypothetical protein
MKRSGSMTALVEIKSTPQVDDRDTTSLEKNATSGRIR